MRAITSNDFGATPALCDLPVPEPGPGEVLVRVQASSVNGFDLAVAAGRLKGMMERRFPVVLGKDFAGMVAAIGPGASRFAVGDRVFGVVMKPVLGDGAFAEYVAVPKSFGNTRLPAGVDLAVAGALGLAGTTALMAVEAVAPAAGETVLISGAKGGVGALAVQLATARGAEVIATARPGADADFVRSLGAAHAVDYNGDLSPLVRAIRPDGVHAAIHLAGEGATLAGLLVPGGRIASALGFGPDAAGERQVTATAIMATPDATTLERLAAEIAAGRLRVPVQRTYRLEEVPQALADFSAGTRGKLAVTL
ncbi:MAG: NADP-dependent oxidoreductase [Chloroflexi bacterium]|nr:NADP-dependent oxidoreductase [Chloroflexota bacterium]